MKPSLYDRVALRRDIDAHGLKRGDLAVLVDRVSHPSGGEDGAVLELIDRGEASPLVVVVPESAIEAIEPDGEGSPRSEGREGHDSPDPATSRRDRAGGTSARDARR